MPERHLTCCFQTMDCSCSFLGETLEMYTYINIHHTYDIIYILVYTLCIYIFIYIYSIYEYTCRHMNPTTPKKPCLKPQKPRRELFGRAHGADDEGDGADEGDHTSFGLRRPLGGFRGFPGFPLWHRWERL